MDRLIEQLSEARDSILVHIVSPPFYSQVVFVISALVLAWLLSASIRARVSIFRHKPSAGALLDLRMAFHNAGDLLLPIITALLLGVGTPIAASVIGETWLVRAAQGLSLIHISEPTRPY